MNTGCDKLDITKDIDLEVEFVVVSPTAAFNGSPGQKIVSSTEPGRG